MKDLRVIQDKRASYPFDDNDDHHMIAAINIGMYAYGKQYKR